MQNEITRELEKSWDFFILQCYLDYALFSSYKIIVCAIYFLHSFLCHKFIFSQVFIHTAERVALLRVSFIFQNCSFSFANTLLTCNPLSCNFETISDLWFFGLQWLTNHDTYGNVWFFIFQIASKSTFSEWLFFIDSKN